MASSHSTPGVAARAATLRAELIERGCTTAHIAQAIAAECGIRPRAAYRYARGYSGQQAADVYNARYGTALSPASMTKKRISEYEIWPLPGVSRRPSRTVLTRLAEIYGTTVDQLIDHHDVRALPPEDARGLLATASASGSPEGGDTTKRRTALKALGLAAGSSGLNVSPGEAMAFTRELERTDLGPDTLEHLDVQLHHLGSMYAASPPAEIWQAAALLRRHTAELLSRRHTLTEGRELARCAGMQSVVLAWAAHDMGRVGVAEAYCVDAHAHGRQAGVPEVCAWADDARATIALYDDRPQQALAAAQRGFAAAPVDSPAAARLAAQISRACAKVGDGVRFEEANRVARQYADRLPAHGAGLFGADAVRLSSYDASSHLWLGDPARAHRAAEQATAQYREVPHGKQSPTRMAIAQIDLGAARAALGEIDGAIESGRAAVRCERLVGSIATRATELCAALMRMAPDTAEVRDFAQEVRTARPPLSR
ncbi:hypothetical protein [Streptomyces gobiensis]|uniref:hypothetical protein n=1 Tax=Streptomyces gobiensis TaxID=2875706 RepID=UPI001E62C55B|nr:hypothetical protein [Streptomyces gobiensis]UGY94245.1 hypothetical protein test1122_22625 [Streptomyces gobiensis]